MEVKLHVCADNVQLTLLEKGISYVPMLLERALLLATRAHSGQKDRQGMSYILHPLVVAMHQKTETRMAIALLHDTIEDTDVTFDGIKQECGETVAIGVDLLTRPDGMTWKTYIGRICGDCTVEPSGEVTWFPAGHKMRTMTHEDAMHVKLADIRHNTDVRRMDHKAAKKYPMYIEAYEYICQQLSLPYPNHAAD